MLLVIQCTYLKMYGCIKIHCSTTDCASLFSTKSLSAWLHCCVGVGACLPLWVDPIQCIYHNGCNFKTESALSSILSYCPDVQMSRCPHVLMSIYVILCTFTTLSSLSVSGVTVRSLWTL